MAIKLTTSRKEILAGQYEPTIETAKVKGNDILSLFQMMDALLFYAKTQFLVPSGRFFCTYWKNGKVREQHPIYDFDTPYIKNAALHEQSQKISFDKTLPYLIRLNEPFYNTVLSMRKSKEEDNGKS